METHDGTRQCEHRSSDPIALGLDLEIGSLSGAAQRAEEARAVIRSVQLAQLRVEKLLNESFGIDDALSVDDIRSGRATLSDGDAHLDVKNEKPTAGACGDRNETEWARIEIDVPRLSDDCAEAPMPGMLSIGGWALAESGIGQISVQVDEGRSLPACLGIRRPDVAAAFPSVSEANFSGFGLVLTARDVGLGQHTIRIAARSNAGRTIERTFTVTMEAQPELSLRQRVSKAEIDQQMSVLHKIRHVPDFVFLMHIQDGDVADRQRIRKTFASLTAQAYPNWRAVVFLGGNCTEVDFAEAANISGGDLLSRIRVQRGSGLALDELLTPAGAEAPVFVMPLLAGNVLGADALIEFASASAMAPGADFYYADERRVDPILGLVQPWMKPDWSPELLMSMNYIGCTWAASIDLIRRANITADELAMFGVYDAVLRLTELSSGIVHVPRSLSESTSEPTYDKDADALRRAVVRRGIRAEVVRGMARGTWRVRMAVDKSNLVSIVIPTCGARDLIKTAIRSIRDNTSYPNVEIVCLDNIPSHNVELKAWLRENADHVVDLPGSFNWSRFNNIGAQAASGEYLLFLNDDIEVRQRDWLEALLEHAQNPEIGVAGARLLYPNGTLQHAGIFLTLAGGRHAFRYMNPDNGGPFGLACVQRNVMAVTGACQMVRRSVFDAIGGFDERHDVINNDVDFCLRAWKHGFRVVYTPFVTLTHHELVSRGHLDDACDEKAFEAAWGSRISAGDPFFNPGLIPDDDNYVADAEPVEVLYTGNPRADRSSIARILVVKLDHIGDFVNAIPALRRLKQSFPNAEITLLGAPASCLLAGQEPSIDHCIEFSFFNPRSELGQMEVDELTMSDLEARLRAQRFDLAIDLRMHTDTRGLLLKTGAKILAGFDHQASFPWLDVALEWEGDKALIRKRAHIVDRLLDLVAVVDGAFNRGWEPLRSVDPYNAIHNVRAALNAAGVSPRLLDRPLVCVHPGVGSAIKQWPLEYFAALIDLLVERECVSVVLVGGRDEEALAAGLAQQVSSSEWVCSIAGQLSLIDLQDVLSACVLFIGNDSGPKHIAAAVGTPTVGIHSSNVDPVEWGPVGTQAVAIHRRVVCGPCFLSDPKDCTRKMACLTGIRPEHVYRAALPFLRVSLSNDEQIAALAK